MNEDRRRLTVRKLADFLWEADGKPEGHGLGEANRGTYERDAAAVFYAIRALGFRIVPEGRKK